VSQIFFTNVTFTLTNDLNGLFRPIRYVNFGKGWVEIDPLSAIWDSSKITGTSSTFKMSGSWVTN